MEQMVSLISLGDGSTLTLDFTTGVLDPRLSFSRSTGGSYVHSDGLLYGFDTSSSSNTIGTGSKTFTLSATAGVNRRYAVGDLIIASSGANNMSGSVTSYDPTTQALVCSMASSSGSGTFTTWIIGNRQPRFDHDPTTLAPKGLLIEGQSVNLALRSDDFNTTVVDGTSWNASGYTAGTLSTTLPDGTTGNARRLTIASGSGSFRSSTITVTASTAYTFSFWARNNGGSQARFRVWNVTAGSSIVDYTQSANNYVSQIGGANNTSSTWVRVSVPFTTPAGCTAIYVYPCSSDSGTVDLLVWGAQLETGSGASSYIPTGASTATRNPDYCVLPTSSFITGNPYPNTLFVDCIPATANTGFPDLARLFDRTAGGTFAYGSEIYYYTAATMSVNRKVSASTNADRTLVTGLAYNTRHKFATAIDSTSFIGSRDGVTDSGATTAPAALASVVTHLGIGCNGDSSPANVMNGWMRQIKFWPTALPQATLNSITTL
jgi:hypothetical protein